MPTISDGFEGFRDLILSAVLMRLPPMTRSYSWPNWLRTLAMAERILRALSSLRKSKNGSVTNGPECRAVRGRTGASSVAITVILSTVGTSLGELSYHFTMLRRGMDGIQPGITKMKGGPCPGQRNGVFDLTP